MSVKEDQDKIVEGMLTIFVGVPISLIIGWTLGGWVLSCLWGWFAVPTLGVSHLTIFQAAGLAMVVCAFSGQYHKEVNFQIINDELGIKTSIFQNIVSGSVAWVVILGFGWALSWFV